MINVLADQYLYNIQSYLPEEVNLILFDPAKGLPTELDDIHGMLVRTVIDINKHTLPSIPKQLTFIGSASAGTDHVDKRYLEENGVIFTNSAGCNARSVAEYVATSMLLWAEHREENLVNLSVGIVGVGHVGTQVVKLMDKLGIQTVEYDPPKEERKSNFTSATLEQVLNCNILTFHTPLTTEAKYPTHHWLDSSKLSDRHFNLIINTSRGGVIDETALLKAKGNETVDDIIIDVWENEPIFNLKTAREAFVKTPHIAGYSVQAKENASKIVADDLLDHFDVPKPKQQQEKKPRIFQKDITEFDSLSSLLTELHPIKEYETELKKIIQNNPSDRGKYFNKLRAEYPLRQEFSNTYLSASYLKRFPVLEKLGFSLITDSK